MDRLTYTERVTDRLTHTDHNISGYVSSRQVATKIKEDSEYLKDHLPIQRNTYSKNACLFCRMRNLWRHDKCQSKNVECVVMLNLNIHLLLDK